MYEVKWMPKTAAELEELCNKAIEHGFELVACNDSFCVFKSTQHSVQADGCNGEHKCLECGEEVTSFVHYGCA